VHPTRNPPDVRLFRSIAELVNVGIWVVDRGGVTVFANGQLAGLLAVDVGRLYSSRLWELIDRGERRRSDSDLELRQPPGTYDVRLVRGDGRPSRLQITTTRWFVSGDHAGSIAICIEGDVAAPRVAPESPRAEPPGWNTLSRREREVIDDIALGDRVPLIASRMYISQSTVRNHLSSAFRKLNVSDQQELVELLRRRPVRSPSPSEHGALAAVSQLYRYMPEPAPGS
jgi:PAS domain S-box-containing protein